MIPLRLYAYGALVVALAGAGWYARGVLAERSDLRAKVEAAAIQLDYVKTNALATQRALEARASDRVRIVTVTKEVLREVPALVPAGTPDLPGGFRVLHDAAALQFSPAASGADATPVPAQAAAETIVDNYGSCADTASRLERLQQWLTTIRGAATTK